MQELAFNSFIGLADYRAALHERYPAHAWLTPSELFKPFYGYMVGNYILDKAELEGTHRLHLLEFGPGRGAMAESILSYFK